MKHMATIDKIRDWLDAYASHLPLAAQLLLVEIVTEDCEPPTPNAVIASGAKQSSGAPFDREAHALADAKARVKGEELDGSPRRECRSV